jgi:endo-1,4-beta-xylanase
MIKLLSNIYVISVLIALASCNQGSEVNEQQELSLKEAFNGKFYIGTALNAYQIAGEDSLSLKVLKKHFNSIVAENCMKSEEIQPKEGVFNFELPDKFVELGEKNNMQIIGHTLIWHSQAPDWLFVDEKGNEVSKEVLIERMKKHISTVVGRYKGRIYGWDVVNEAFNDDGSWRESKFYKIIGKDYIKLAFEFAHEADPDAELYYNDFNMAKPGRRDSVISLITELKQQGVKIDGIGLQGHYTMTHPLVKDYDKALEMYSKLGLKLMITEMDLTVLPWPTEKEGADISLTAEYQEKMNPYPNGMPDSASLAWSQRCKKFFDLYIKYQENISRVTMWGIHDDQSWRNNWPIKGRKDYPLLFDRNLEPKKVVSEIIEDATKNNKQ